MPCKSCHCQMLGTYFPILQVIFKLNLEMMNWQEWGFGLISLLLFCWHFMTHLFDCSPKFRFRCTVYELRYDVLKKNNYNKFALPLSEPIYSYLLFPLAILWYPLGAEIPPKTDEKCTRVTFTENNCLHETTFYYSNLVFPVCCS